MSNNKRQKLNLLLFFVFFNYTRTGNENNITTGRISFNSQQTNTISLTDVFTINSDDVDNDTNNVETVTINVNGDTTYDRDVEYLVSVVNVSNTVGTKVIPISISATASGTLGTIDEDYFDNRETATSHIYKVLAKDTISDNDQLMVGYIVNNATGINGTITIKAYIDKDKIAVSDTYPESEGYNINKSAGAINSCINFFTELLNDGILEVGETIESFCEEQELPLGLPYKRQS